MVKIFAAPKQVMPLALYSGVTVIVATMGAFPVLKAVKAAILPIPLAARPMEGVLFIHLKTTPLGVPVKLTAVVRLPLQTTWLAGWLTVGVGLTVMVKV